MSEHHLNCYQRTGVPDDLPAGLCDCRVLRMLDAATPPASDVDSDNAAAGGAEGLDEALADVIDSVPDPIIWHDGYHVASMDMARAILASPWLAAHVAQAKESAWDEGWHTGQLWAFSDLDEHDRSTNPYGTNDRSTR